jgi:hypothetical protein
MDFTSQSKLFGFGKPIKVKPLTEDDAVNLGSKLLCIFHKKKKIYIYQNMFIIKQTNSISNMKTSDHYHPDLIDFNSLLDRLLFLSSNSNILLLTSLSSVSTGSPWP